MKKGDLVVKFANWDNKGTFTFRDMVVESWGKKRATLRDSETGEMLGESLGANFRVLVLPANQFTGLREDEAYAVKLAEEFLIEERARLNRCLERNADNEVYCDYIRESIAELHEPRGIDYNEAVAQIYNQVSKH
jgi:hypothetical protein